MTTLSLKAAALAREEQELDRSNHHLHPSYDDSSLVTVLRVTVAAAAAALHSESESQTPASNPSNLH